MPQTDGHVPWSPDDIDAYRARWPLDTPQRLGMELLSWTAARIGDGVRLGEGMIGRDGVLCFAQNKTGAPVYIPWSCALPAYAEPSAGDTLYLMAALAARSERHMTILATAGKTRSVKGLGNPIADGARDAGLADRTGRTRKARLTALADGGATAHQIAAWSGHLTLAEVEHYTRSADRRRAMRGTEQDQNSVNHLAG